MVRRKVTSDWMLDVGGALLVVAIIVAAVVWGYQEQHAINTLRSTADSIQSVQNHNAPKVKASAKNSATSAEASKKALAIVDSIPQFTAALIAGQNNLNAHLAWIECAMTFGASNCGPPPAIQAPVTTPATAPPPAPAATPPRATPAPAPKSPAPAPTTPTTNPGHGRGPAHPHG